MMTFGNPAGCCCPPHTGSGCTVSPIIGFTFAIACCDQIPVQLTVTLPGDGDDEDVVVASCERIVGNCDFAIDLPPGTVLNWTATAEGLPDRSGTITVPDCGGMTYAPPILWSVIDLIGDTVNATVTADDATVGGGGTWSGALTWDGQVHITPGVRGSGFLGTADYIWEACVNVGSYGWLSHTVCAFGFNPNGDCNDYTPYGGQAPTRGLDLIYVGKVYYGSTRIRFTLSYDFRSTQDIPDTPCRTRLTFQNFWDGDCTGFSPGTDPPYTFSAFFSDTAHYPCGFGEPEYITGYGQTSVNCDLETAQPQTSTDIFPRCTYPTTGVLFPTVASGQEACAPLDYYAELALNPCNPVGTATAHVTL